MTCTFSHCTKTSAAGLINKQKAEQKNLRKGGIDIPGTDPEIFKKEGALCRPPFLVDEENSRFQMV